MKILVQAELTKPKGGKIEGHTILSLGEHKRRYEIREIDDNGGQKIEISRGEKKYLIGEETTFDTPEARVVAEIYGKFLFGIIQRINIVQEAKIIEERILRAEFAGEKLDLLKIFESTIQRSKERFHL